MLVYDIYGNGPPLLLLHGFTGSAEEWLPLRPYWADVRTLIAPDLIGHGRSPAPTDASCYTMERCVSDLLALLDHLGLAQVDVLGYSMGGRVALQLAAAAPKRVQRMILESASPGLATTEERAARSASDHALAEAIERNGLAWFVDYWAALPLFASQASLPTTQRAQLSARRLRGSPHGYANSLRGMGTGQQSSLWEQLSTMLHPTLLISGALDHKFVALNQAMARQLPNASHGIIAHAGHTVHLEQPEAFAQAVRRFL
ncbi:2-succinyl-6-hydroxy-2,4-cyclohexadiene-1-carboxylate synthase [Candidatus Viridilinea mediisalina]|uniref:Putative 2-succinyl-6-hydroxy-2,4-cyclohexadiene-1-carboxylate synthase n=1 Tax=Candidatus Viridilinea mediisalina TaxID=2024553 RepID=A0A2A6RPH7_9CHLR|nr:2-succinyl-6-hydroxy-2,4-cyclohexadiene-1-carboxylate synthase [Candidatus Viridilinea mediisalina]PDW04779.1 2-succinyl-6-hydroxy-2,4-cyclohexadiene-1-carboxylate synthase [Candidatus Viridilinea mediisalina]